MTDIAVGKQHKWRVDEVQGFQLAQLLADLEKNHWNFVSIVPRGLDDRYKVISSNYMSPSPYQEEDL